MKQRFKNTDFNNTYWIYSKIPPNIVKRLFTPGSNRDQAFRDGFINFRCKYVRSSILYAIYVAGKEWRSNNNEYKDLEIKKK